MNSRLARNVGLLLTLLLAGCNFSRGQSLPATASPAPVDLSSLTPPAASPSAAPLPTATQSPTSTPGLFPIGPGSVGQLALLRTLDHPDLVRSVAFSPDGETLASSSGNTSRFTIRLWSVDDGGLVRELAGHTQIVWHVAFSPDGRSLASTSSDKTGRVWNPADGSVRRVLNLPAEAVGVAFSPDSNLLAVGGVRAWPEAAVWLWDTSTWNQVRRLDALWNVPEVAFSPDGSVLAGGGTDRNVRVWRVSDGARLFLLHHAGQVTSLDISPNGALLAAGLCALSTVGPGTPCVRGEVWLWRLGDGSLVNKLQGHTDWVEGVRFSPDGTLLASAGRDGTVRLWRVEDGTQLFALGAHSGGATCVAFSPDGLRLASGGNDDRVRLWGIRR